MAPSPLPGIREGKGRFVHCDSVPFIAMMLCLPLESWLSPVRAHCKLPHIPHVRTEVCVEGFHSPTEAYDLCGVGSLGTHSRGVHCAPPLGLRWEDLACTLWEQSPHKGMPCAYLNLKHLMPQTMATSKGCLKPGRPQLYPETWTLCAFYKHGLCCADIFLLSVKGNEVISSEASVLVREEIETETRREKKRYGKREACSHLLPEPGGPTLSPLQVCSCSCILVGGVWSIGRDPLHLLLQSLEWMKSKPRPGC